MLVNAPASKRRSVHLLLQHILISGVAVALGMAVAVSNAQSTQATPAPAPAPAATPSDQADQADQNQELQEVVVTGSYIPRTDTETPSPVQVITSQQIQQSGYTSIQQVLNDLTANGQGNLSQSFSGAFASGASGIALRGLNVGDTLVLINGQRTTPYPIGDDGYRTFVDTANLPFEAIDHIDVLKDGASAIYGSDAIAGVVNIVLKKTFEGAQFTADGGVSGHGDGLQQHYAAMLGHGDLASDGYNAYVSAEYRQQNVITYLDRGGTFENRNYTSSGGIDDEYGAPNPLTPLPGSSTGYITNSSGTPAGFMTGCNLTAFNAGQCTYKDTWDQIQPPTQNVNVVGRVTQQIASNWTLAFDGGYFQSWSEQVGRPDGPNQYANGYQGIEFGPGIGPTLLPTVPPITVPSTNPSFPAGTGLTSGLLRYTFLNLGPITTQTDSSTVRAVFDLNGSVAGWTVDGSVGYTEDMLELTGLNYISETNLQTALDSTTDPFLIGQANSAALNDFVAPILRTTDTSKLAFAHAGATRSLLSLPGGPLSIAFGTDFHTLDEFALAPPQVQSGIQAVGDFSNNFTIGSEHVQSAYVELDAPVIKQFEADAAARYDHYNQVGGKLSPKLGLKYTPISQFAVRGTASEGFVAPSPGENGRAGQSFFAGTVADPVLCPNPSNITAAGNFAGQCVLSIPGLQKSNPNLSPETSKEWTLGVVTQPVHDISATLDYYSIEIDHQIVPGDASAQLVRGNDLAPLPEYQPNGTTVLTVPPVPQIAYYGITYINANTTKTSGFDLGLNYSHRFDFGTISSNATWTYINKYDITIDGVTYVLAGTHGPTFYSGDTGNPKSRVQWSLSFSQPAWEVTGTLNYIDSFEDVDPSAAAFGEAPQATCLQALTNGGGFAGTVYSNQLAAGNIPSNVGCTVGNFITYDLYGVYNITPHLNIHASALNVFNAKAPLDWVTYGGALGAVPWNPSMHLQGAIGQFFTLGVSYKL